MKNLMKLLTVLTFLVMIGCAEDTNLVSPFADVSLEETDLSKVTWISLPPSADVERGGDKQLKTKEKINGKNGGKLSLEESYGGRRDKITITASLEFPEGAFEGERDIAMVLEDQYGTVSFSPSGSFLLPANYDLKIEGINLKDVEENKVMFVYLAQNGSIEVVECSELIVDKRNEILEVRGAQIPHFSRFGFVK